jgi:hypothetical protein
MKKSELEEGFADWAARQGLMGKERQLGAIAKRHAELSSSAAGNVFSGKLAGGLNSAIASGMVDVSLPPTPSQQTLQKKQKQRQKQSQLNAGYAPPSTDADINIRGYVYKFTVADKQWRTPQGKVVKGQQDIQTLNKMHYDSQSTASQATSTAVPESADYSEFNNLFEQKLIENTTGISVAQWIVKFVMNEIALERLPSLDATGMNQLKNLAERFQMAYTRTKPQIPTSEVNKLFSFLQSWSTTNSPEQAQQARTQDVSDVLTSTIRNLGTASTDGSDNFSQLAQNLSKLMAQLGQINPSLPQAIINSYNRNASRNP